MKLVLLKWGTFFIFSHADFEQCAASSWLSCCSRTESAYKIPDAHQSRNVRVQCKNRIWVKRERNNRKWVNMSEFPCSWTDVHVEMNCRIYLQALEEEKEVFHINCWNVQMLNRWSSRKSVNKWTRFWQVQGIHQFFTSNQEVGSVMLKFHPNAHNQFLLA